MIRNCDGQCGEVCQRQSVTSHVWCIQLACHRAIPEFRSITRERFAAIFRGAKRAGPYDGFCPGVRADTIGMCWTDLAEDEEEMDTMESSAVRECTPMLHVGASCRPEKGEGNEKSLN